MARHEIDIGDIVVCDFCNDDYTNSDSPGGALIGSYSICPKCAEKAQKSEDFEGFDAVCPSGMTFKQWVLEMRGGDNRIIIEAME